MRICPQFRKISTTVWKNVRSTWNLNVPWATSWIESKEIHNVAWIYSSFSNTRAAIKLMYRLLQKKWFLGYFDIKNEIRIATSQLQIFLPLTRSQKKINKSWNSYTRCSDWCEILRICILVALNKILQFIRRRMEESNRFKNSHIPSVSWNNFENNQLIKIMHKLFRERKNPRKFWLCFY